MSADNKVEAPVDGATKASPLNKTTQRGAFFVFEGADKTGKSTQARLLNTHLNESGRKSELISFPDRSTPIGKVIDAALRGNVRMPPKSLDLLFIANRYELADKIRKTLDAGTNIICDRYSASGVVFAISANNDYTTVEQELELPAPDMIFCMFAFDLKSLSYRYTDKKEVRETDTVQAKVNSEFVSMGCRDIDKWHFYDAAESSAWLAKNIAIDAVRVLDSDKMRSPVRNLTREDFWSAVKGSSVPTA